LISKSGYGIVTEAACNGIPTLLVPREGWPEEPPLRDWLGQHGRTLMLSENQLKSGTFSTEVQAVRNMPTPASPQPTGIAEAAAILAALLQ
jgi:predicted glycosyltransferase